MKILVSGIDDVTTAFLRTNGFVVECEAIEDAEDLYGWLADDHYDAGVIHLDQSGLGIYAARSLRSQGLKTSLIGVSGQPEDRSWSDQRALFLENGGDDLLQTPLNPRELIASLRATTRRFNGAVLDIHHFKSGAADLKINMVTHSITVNDVNAGLTGKERAILMALASSPGRTMSKETLLSLIYLSGVEDEPEIKIIDVFICKVRKKLALIHPSAGLLIQTVWGRGYRLSELEEEELQRGVSVS